MREGETYGSWVWAEQSPRGATQSSVGLKYFYASGPWSPVAEAYHNRARWYSSEAGRFLTLDPIGYLSGVNQYTYANGNPIGFRDPRILSGFLAYPMTSGRKENHHESESCRNGKSVV